MVPEVASQLVQARGYLFAVADGMGGYGDGHKASELCLRTLYAAYYGADACDLPNAIQLAHMAVRRLAMQPENDARLGTTLVAALFRDNSLLVAHVGDSRAYVVRGARIWRITQDHAAVQEQAPATNIITRSIGGAEVVCADYTPVHELQPGDVLVLCSDGLTNQVADDEIARAVAAHAPARAADALVRLANQRGGPDNITVQLVRVNGRPFRPREPRAGRPARGRALMLLGVLLIVAVAVGMLALIRL